MSLTSYRAAPPRGGDGERRAWVVPFGGPGGGLLFRALRRSTMGAAGFHGRVRDGIGWDTRAFGPPGRRNGTAPCCGAGSGGVNAGWHGDGVWRPGLAAGVGGRELDRAIRTGKLRVSPRFDSRPIDVMVSHGSRRDLVSRGVSRLDAFSGYPVQT